MCIRDRVSYEDGSSDRLTGTPNHPFWVPAVRDYVPLGKLEVGTVLHVQGGGEAILVSKTWRQGEFAAERSDVGESPERSAGTVRVFDFEVEGLHNFYVRGEGSDAAGVLVHNSTARDMSKFDFGKHLRGMIGDPPAGMHDPHAHHVLFKVGNGSAQKALVAQGQDILRSVGIDPIYGKEVLGWAPNRVKGQHSKDALQPLVDRLQETVDAGGGYDEVVEVLDHFKDIAAGRGP